MEIKDVGQRIAKLRKEHGWSQRELAEKLNVSDKTVSKWENGGVPSIDLFPAIAKLFAISIDYLITGNEKDDSSQSVPNGEAEDTQDPTDASSDAAPETEKLGKEVLRRKLPKSYTCPMCGRVNINPGAHCAYCYHEFDPAIIDALEEVEITEENAVTVNPDIVFDDETQKPICPMCGKANPYFGDHCVFCYHEFKHTASDNTDAAAPTKKSYFSESASTGNSVPQSTNQLGCLAYIIAFLFPLIGLIWGAVRKDRGIVIFSVVLMLINLVITFIVLIILWAVGALAFSETLGALASVI